MLIEQKTIIQQQYLQEFWTDSERQDMVVTGSVSGLGKSIAEYMTPAGANIVLTILHHKSTFPEHQPIRSTVVGQQDDKIYCQYYVILKLEFQRYFIIIKNKLRMFGLMLKGKTAVVTGSLSGIGLGIAQALAGCGANVVLNGFAPEDEIAKTEKALTSANSQAKFIFADLTKPADSRDLVKKSIAHFGKVDILVNNAGMQHIDKTEDFPDAQWERVIALNLSSNFYTIAEALPGMKQRKWGRIINIASAHGLVASPNKSAYCASKFGVVGLTKVVALENAKEGVTCNAICPGFVMTPLIEKQIHIIMEKRGISFEEASEVLCSEKHPTGRLGRPEDLGALAAFLCSDNAVQMTGSSYSMDGGWTAI